ncbi:hypothetical protein [Brevundimonas sp. NIBR11]|uniref:hypothetical protein n=1 Tax=Brevundimonas sp. NIBR11 TaxID=3015999 RepID=UPI0022F0A164|nr:hypothetical protein [Brevundimonas sp. NIBR11]WGM32456.1 hypothetical protein KKHFBJBL_02708 [Brevundimonas sp. NIBR11]
MVERAVRVVGGRTPKAAALAVAVLAIGLTAAPAGSQTRPAPPPPNPDMEARAITQMVTAAEVAAWARERRDARAMLVAARMLGDIRTRRENGDEPFLTTAALLDEAESFAGGDRDLLDQISMERSPDKGVRASPFGAGPIVVVRRLRARETYSFTIEARRSEVLRVAAIGDGDTNIDLALRDQNGAVICADGSRDHYPVCTVARPRSGPIRVEIVNRGEVWSRVQILTN